MKRSEMIEALRETEREWDVIIIGGGATGLGVAVDAASRGYKTLLLEKNDFAHGTSSRSTKLVHGGVRYLEQGNISLVFEALRERGILMKNAPHLVHKQPFMVPHYKRWRGLYYWLGLKMYDLLAGRFGIGSSKHLSKKEAEDMVPKIASNNLRGGILYYDGHFDDSRLAINLAQTSAEEGGTLINYMKVTGLIKADNKVKGVTAKDELSGEEYSIKGQAVINATGVFTDEILAMDDSISDSVIAPSQGIHIVIDSEFLSSDTAVMIPETKDGRVLFAIPWYDKVMIGTTDTPVDEVSSEPEALESEIDYILEHIDEYLVKKPERSDIKSVFAGLRPLVKNGDSEDTSEISRDHSLFVTPSGLITIAGGKWTTYRKMAEDVVDRASKVADLEKKECITKELKIHGWDSEVNGTRPLDLYGDDRNHIEKIVEMYPEYGEPLHERLPYIKAEVIWAARNEMAMTVEDFNSRRTRALFLDAKASEEMAPEVARLMAKEYGHDEEWIEDQLESYSNLAQTYQVKEK